MLLYETGHIPGAVKVDWHTELNDPVVRDYLDGEGFAKLLSKKGIARDDTVVIYDRIRENLRKYRKMAIVPLLNLSLNETLSRTLVTSLSILLALGMLLLLGPEVIFGLTIAIFLGIFVGTYSSIYISATVLVWLGVKPDSFLQLDDKDELEKQPA